MSNIELFYDHCAAILGKFYNRFPVRANFDVRNPDRDPDQLSDEELYSDKQWAGALHWLHANKYIIGNRGEWSLEDAALTEKGMCFLRQHMPFDGKHELPDFRRAAEHLFS